MDSVTQAALGAAIGEAVLGHKIGKRGAILGAAIATIPDLDVLLYAFYSSLDMLSIHRGLSHSILCSILAAFVLAWLLKRAAWTRDIGYRRLWFFVWVTWFTHILLDAFTAYGTQLFLPWSDERFGFDSINVVDPVYTVPLLIGTFCSLKIFKNKPNRTIYNTIGLVVSSIYLFGTLGVKNYVDNYFSVEYQRQNIDYQSLLTMPVGVGNLHWYGVAKDEKGIYLSQFSLLGNTGNQVDFFPTNDDLLAGVDQELVDVMRWFSKGFYTVSKEGNEIKFYNLQVDMGGVVNKGGVRAPTLGYFTLTKQEDGSFAFASGRHR